MERLLQQVYSEAEASEVPKEIVVPVLPSDLEAVNTWLEEIRGARVNLHVAQRGGKRELAQTVRRNAEQALNLHKTRRAGDLTARSQALADLAAQLDLAEAPLRIECYDISHTGGTDQVGSMVVFEDGLPKKGDYRHFIIRGEEGEGAADDTAAMAEVLRRRFARQVNPEAETEESTGGAPKRPRFAYPPNLVVVDGGAPQVAAAARALDELGIVDLAVIGIAKRLEEVWLPGETFPLVLPRTSEGLYLLQRVRDEAHRFAITHHRKRRAKRQVRSELDEVPGLGPTRRAALLKKFGSLRAIKAASVAELQSADGMGPRLAEVVHEHFSPTAGP